MVSPDLVKSAAIPNSSQLPMWGAFQHIRMSHGVPEERRGRPGGVCVRAVQSEAIGAFCPSRPRC